MSSLISKGYTPCEYIESSGTQYIDTGFKPNQDTRVIMDVKGYSITSNVWAFCARNSASSNNLGLFYYYAQSKKWAVDYSTSSNRQQFDGISSDERLYIDHNKNVTTINNVTINNTYTTFQPSYNLVLLACNTAGSISGHMKAYLYSCKIYDNGTLIRDFKPCRNSSGVYGLFDEINDVFYTTPSGSFTGYTSVSSVQFAQSFRRRLLVENFGKVDYEKEYLTIEALEDGTIRCGNEDEDTYPNPVYYSKNGGEWIGSTKRQSISVVSGDRVRFKAVRAEGDPDISFKGTTRYNVYGNIMSLLYGDDFVGQTSMPAFAFRDAFRDSSVNDASKLILPSTTLSSHCYYYMFYGCTELTTAPELPAATLVSFCYSYMFYNCHNLKYIKMLAVGRINYWSLQYWVYNVLSGGTFVKHPDQDSLPGAMHNNNYIGVPQGWTVIDASV